MPEEFDQPEKSEEDLRDENEFLKMKMMLENGAQFGSSGDVELSPEIENKFLKQMIEFEKQFRDAKPITVGEKIGGDKPAFRKVAEIPDDEIEAAWKELKTFMRTKGINAEVCSPYVQPRELYRWVTEELFKHEGVDIDIPNMSWNYIYDEFHPEPHYECERAVHAGLRTIFRKDATDYLHRYRDHGLTLNQHEDLTPVDFKARIDRFQQAHDWLGYDLTEAEEEEEAKEQASWANPFAENQSEEEDDEDEEGEEYEEGELPPGVPFFQDIDPRESYENPDNLHSIIDDDKATVTGQYKAMGRVDDQVVEYSGDVTAWLVYNAEHKYWELTGWRFSDINF